MFAFTILCFSFFISLVHAGPLSLRDVFNPHIITPDAKTVWPVGTQQTVTWETDNIPPDSQLTRPDGKVVLGHLGPTGGLNLQSTPLAQNFLLRDGKVQITVPNVPPRDDYIIVLMGDSGNASPGFAITSGASTPSNLSTGTTVRDATSSSSTLITTPIPITGSVITGGSSNTITTPTATFSLSTSDTSPSSTPATTSPSAPSPSTTSSSTTSSSTNQTSPVPDTTGTNSAGSLHKLSSMTAFTVGIISTVLVLV